MGAYMLRTYIPTYITMQYLFTPGQIQALSLTSPRAQGHFFGRKQHIEDTQPSPRSG